MEIVYGETFRSSPLCQKEVWENFSSPNHATIFMFLLLWLSQILAKVYLELWQSFCLSLLNSGIMGITYQALQPQDNKTFHAPNVMKISSQTSLCVKELCDFASCCCVQPHVTHKHQVGHAGIETKEHSWENGRTNLSFETLQSALNKILTEE